MLSEHFETGLYSQPQSLPKAPISQFQSKQATLIKRWLPLKRTASCRRPPDLTFCPPQNSFLIGSIEAASIQPLQRFQQSSARVGPASLDCQPFPSQSIGSCCCLSKTVAPPPGFFIAIGTLGPGSTLQWNHGWWCSKLWRGP